MDELKKAKIVSLSLFHAIVSINYSLCVHFKDGDISSLSNSPLMFLSLSASVIEAEFLSNWFDDNGYEIHLLSSIIKIFFYGFTGL